MHEKTVGAAALNGPARRAAACLTTLTVLEAGLLLLGNFLGAKIWHLGPIIQDGGVVVFPIIYVVGDLLMELYGRKLANQALRQGCLLNLIAVAACLIVSWLPELPDANTADFDATFDLSTRVMLASIIGFLLSGLLNNWSFQKIQQHTSKRAFWLRSLGSSLGAHALDAVVFNAIAFGGRVNSSTLAWQTFCAFLVGMSIETLLNPLTKWLALRLEQRLNQPTNAAPL